MGEPARAYVADPFSYAEARALSEELGVSEPVAITLVRRGFRTPEQARSFLTADEEHDPMLLESMGPVVARLLAAIADGERITVHGDFDVDGVCATAVAVGALRELGAECDWLIPDRLADGYGIAAECLQRLRERGTDLVLSVDCGITAVEEAKLAREVGLELIVTDHHQPKSELPDCLVLHPGLGGYPFAELCGTAVAWKLTAALRDAAGQPPEAAAADLDLVALATVADVVPLLGENRALVRRGVEVARRAARPGLRALLAAAGCEPARLDASDFAFRLGPRINAAGRLYRADAGVELFLTADAARAREIADELDRANAERKSTEREVDAAAEAARRDLPPELRDAPALVVAGRGWHPGVVGIVASRLAERHWRPTIVISLDEDGGGRGSGRSIPGFDLLAGLEACAGHLERFGGHRAAAGLELAPGALDGFRRAFAVHAEAVLGPAELTQTERVDAIVGGPGIGLELAEELERLGPFGAGNPAVRLLVPSARVRDVRSMGEGRHSRFSLHSGGHRALAVAFGRSSVPEGELPVDATVALELNQWNGTVEPRLVLRELYPAGAGEPEEPEPAHDCDGDCEGWWQRLEAELVADPALPPGGAWGEGAGADGRRVVPHSGSAASVLAELVSSGERVLAVCADASRRAQLALGAAGLARFGGGAGTVVCGRCDTGELGRAAAGSDGLVLADWDAVGASSPSTAAVFTHVVVVDPPPFRHLDEGLLGGAGGYLHPVWGEAELSFALAVLEEQLGLRAPLASLFRSLRTGGPCEGEELRAALSGDGRFPRSPELAGRCLRVFGEVGLVEGKPSSGTGTVGVVSSERTELTRSAAFRAYAARHEEARRYLESRRRP
jgi:single-stranded-DNA-specific exonuclease